MSGGGLDELTTAQKRALLAEHLRKRSRLAPSPAAIADHAAPAPADDGASPRAPSAGRRSFLDDEVIELASLRDWSAQEQHPYIRYVAPYKGFLYQRLGLDKTFVRGEGCHLIDADGTRYADFIAQFGAVPFGHHPEAIWKALEAAWREELPNLVITSISNAQGELAARLLAVAPPGLGHVVFTNSGAEAVEAAIKLARSRTGRTGILSACNAFHGLTLAGMSATDTAFFQRGFGAPVPGFSTVPFGDLAALRAALEAQPDFLAAFLVEIIQGESGIQVAPPGYLAAARDLCHRHGALLIVDEVQTGLGRTGSLFACEAEGVTPDILCLAKALGGGLIPIGACLYSEGAYSEQFDLRHGSTFAGNTLACRAALAAIDELTKDDGRLVRHVAETGDRLLAQLRELQRDYPLLIKEIRGRGFMLGVELDFQHVAATRRGMLAMLQEQGLLLYVVVSYLLNVEHVRIAPSFTHGTVLRIEPPLIADAALCDHLIVALRRLLDALQRGDAAQLVGHLMGRSRAGMPVPFSEPRRTAAATAAAPRASGRREGARFAFIVHLLDADSMRRFDASLAPFSDAELEGLKSRITEFIKPYPFGELTVRSADGRRTEGELIALPHLPAELLALSEDDAVALVQSAVDLAVERGAEVVGLAGFSSIVTFGGLALHAREGVRVTSGNSYTSWVAMQALEAACADQGVSLADRTVAVVGATGAIGHALSLLCAERAAELILIGNPQVADASVGRLRLVAEDCERHVRALAAAGRKFRPGTFAERVLRRPAAAANADAGITVTTDIDQHLPRAHAVLTATNAVLPFISARHLRKGALVCDISRPFNVAPDLGKERHDVRMVDGGLVQAPEGSVLELLEEPDRRNVLLACAAETIILALSGFRSEHLCGRLDPATIEDLGKVAASLGFSAAR
jgi:acetylornithine/succinyldiaminopimelate/putrescine aminotransferase/predicted amino acid dehydrogenase